MDDQRRMQQCCLGDVRLWKDKKLIENDTTWETLIQAESVALKLDNQKNEIRGVLIHHTVVSGKMCPVKALARQVYHLNKHGTGDLEVE